MPLVALATCADLPDLDADSALAVPALRAAGLDVDVRVWDDASTDWGAYDLVVVRSTWDYVPRREEFLAWARGVPRLANAADVLAWNTDKRYLHDLARAGVPVVPTTFRDPGEAYDPPPGEHVVKPAVSVGAQDTERIAAGASGADLVERLHAAGRTVMVQPYLGRVDVEGETAVLVFGGEVSHAARKTALLVPGAPSQSSSGADDGVMSPREASAAEVAVAGAAVAAAPGELLYARVDLLPTEDGPVVVELEATEPSLFLRQAPGSAERFARAVERAVPRAR